MIALLFVLVAAVIQIVFYWTGFGQTRDMRWVNTRQGVSYTPDAGPLFYAHGGRFFYIVTRDGVRYISAENSTTRWHHSLSLTRPLMATRGDRIAVTEEYRGRTIYVFDPNGLYFSVTMAHPVHVFSINPAGFLAVVVQLDGGYAVYVFTQQSTQRPGGRAYIYRRPVLASQVVPVAVEVSEDGRYIALAMLDISHRLHTWIDLGFVNERDAQGTTDGTFASRQLEDQILLAMRFMEGNRLLVVTDTQVVCFARGPGHQVLQDWQHPLHNRLDHIAFDGDNRFVLALGERVLNAADPQPPGTVLMYDISGRRTGSYAMGRRVTHLTAGHGMVIVGAGRSFHAVCEGGVRQWEYIALHDTRDILFLESTSSVLVAGLTRADVWRRQRTRSGEPGDIFGIQQG